MEEAKPVKWSLKELVITIGVAAGFGLILFFFHLITRPSDEEARARPNIVVVTRPMVLPGRFFGLVLGDHKPGGPARHQEWPVHVFFLKDDNGSPFRSDLPDSIGVGYIVAKYGTSTVYCINRKVETRYALGKNLGGKIAVFLDNATDSDVIVMVDSNPELLIPSLSHAKITLKKGIHTFESRFSESSRPPGSIKAYLEDLEFYIYNIDERNIYHLQSSLYRSPK